MIDDMRLKAKEKSLGNLMDAMGEDSVKDIPKIQISISRSAADELQKGIQNEMGVSNGPNLGMESEEDNSPFGQLVKKKKKEQEGLEGM